MQAKALVCEEPKGPLRVLSVELPELGPEDVRVKVTQLIICYSRDSFSFIFQYSKCVVLRSMCDRFGSVWEI